MHNESVILKKEGKLAICNNMDEPGGHYASEIARKRKTSTTWYHLCVEP